MGSRERKRAQRRKRKRRSAERTPTADTQPHPADGPASDAPPPSRSELRDQEARAALEPLAEGERPGAVTVGAVLSALLALVFTVSTIVAAVGSVEIEGEEPSPVPLAGFAIVLWVMVWGMWKARYWAVLGFQMLLLLFMLSAAIGLVGATTILQAVATFLLIAGSGALFYFMIRAMARIQMPERRAPGQPDQRRS